MPDEREQIMLKAGELYDSIQPEPVVRATAFVIGDKTLYRVLVMKIDTDDLDLPKPKSE